MELFHLEDLLAERARSGRPYLELLRVPDLSTGLYVLPAGGADPQKPHAEDELYYVISGCGVVRVDAEDQPVRTGSIVFVKAGVEHRFHSIAEELVLLVFFGPAEGTKPK